MIEIHKSKTADTRSCDFSRVTKEQLLSSSVQHIGDVEKGIGFLVGKLCQSAALHDHDKISNIDGFHADFVTGFAQTGWWDEHRKINRHHLLQEDGIPVDVNLVDVLDMIVDCVMAGMGRTGSVYPLDIPPELLKRAFDNTVELLKAEIIASQAEEIESLKDKVKHVPTKDKAQEIIQDLQAKLQSCNAEIESLKRTITNVNRAWENCTGANYPKHAESIITSLQAKLQSCNEQLSRYESATSVETTPKALTTNMPTDIALVQVAVPADLIGKRVKCIILEDTNETSR